LLTYFDQPVLHLLVFPSVLVFLAMLVFSRTSQHASLCVFPRASGLKFIRILSGLFPDLDMASLGEQFGLLVFSILLCKAHIILLVVVGVTSALSKRVPGSVCLLFSVPLAALSRRTASGVRG
jgi:hypothetical protein